VNQRTHATVTSAGASREESRQAPRPQERSVSPDVVWEAWNIPRQQREARNGHPGAVLWFTGLSAAGKSTIAREVERRLFARGCHTIHLDGDQVRHGLCGDLGFSAEDRTENIRRVGEVAHLFFQSGAIVLCCFISPFKSDRDRARRLIPEGRFFEVFVDATLDTVSKRDPKGLYEKALRGEIAHFTGVSDPYERPEQPELVIHTDNQPVAESVQLVIDELVRSGIID